MHASARIRAKPLFTVLAGSVLLSTALTAVAGIHASGDLFVGVWNPSQTRWEATTSVCVWNEAGDGGAYRVRVDGSNDNDSYALADSSGSMIDYRLRWVRSGPRGQRERLEPGKSSRGVYTFADEPGCHADTAPSLSVRINDRALDRALPGIYTDTLFVTIEPL